MTRKYIPLSAPPPVTTLPAAPLPAQAPAPDGVLVQIGGSQSPWLEDRGPKLMLLIAVPYATRIAPTSRTWAFR